MFTLFSAAVLSVAGAAALPVLFRLFRSSQSSPVLSLIPARVRAVARPHSARRADVSTTGL